MDVRHAAQLLERAGRERDLAAVDRVEADAADIVDRGVQPGGAGSVDGAGLELVGSSAYVAPSRVTVSIISPPERNGGISSSSSRRP